MGRIKAAAEPEAPPKKTKSKDTLYAELETMLMIDKDGLDEALIQQPDLIFRVSSTIVDFLSRRDAAKQDRDEAMARADAEVRRDAAKAEEKITADQVKAEVKLNKNVIEASDRFADLDYQVNKWGALKEAFISRGHVLRDLVSLHGNNYWSDASSGRASSRQRATAGEEARVAMAEARRGVRE